MAVPISRFIQHDVSELLYAAQARVLRAPALSEKRLRAPNAVVIFAIFIIILLNENKGLIKPLFIIWLTGSYQKEYFTPTR